jgi:hypothetical protein
MKRRDDDYGLTADQVEEPDLAEAAMQPCEVSRHSHQHPCLDWELAMADIGAFNDGYCPV